MRASLTFPSLGASDVNRAEFQPPFFQLSIRHTQHWRAEARVAGRTDGEASLQAGKQAKLVAHSVSQSLYSSLLQMDGQLESTKSMTHV